MVVTPEKQQGMTGGLSRARVALRPARRAVRTVKERMTEQRDPTLGWLGAARRQHVATIGWDDLEANRLRLINRLAPGRTFLDLGGMYRIAGEMAFSAERAGASRVVLFDGMDPSDEFIEKHAT